MYSSVVRQSTFTHLPCIWSLVFLPLMQVIFFFCLYWLFPPWVWFHVSRIYIICSYHFSITKIEIFFSKAFKRFGNWVSFYERYHPDGDRGVNKHEFWVVWNFQYEVCGFWRVSILYIKSKGNDHLSLGEAGYYILPPIEIRYMIVFLFIKLLALQF